MSRSSWRVIAILGIVALLVGVCAVALSAVILIGVNRVRVSEATRATSRMGSVPSLTPTPVTALRTPTPAPSLTPTPVTALPTSTPVPSPIPTLPPTSASPAASPEPSAPSATLPQPSEEIGLELFEDLDLVSGQLARLEGTDIEVMLVEAHGPPPDCFDCPNAATLIVFADGETLELRYSFSGNMLFELLQKARRKAAFGFVFVAVRIDEGSFTLRVEPNTK